MYVVIMGCGRVGSSLAAGLERLGHEVAVIDRDPQAFRRLGPDFAGPPGRSGWASTARSSTQAGIERPDAFAAVSSGDNSNIIAARVARETFGVERVVARIYDAKRAAVYERLGIPTVATVPWSTDRLLRMLLPDGVADGVARAHRHGRDPAAAGARGLGRAARSASWRRPPAPGSRSSSGSAPACCPTATPSCRPTTRSTWPPSRAPSATSPRPPRRRPQEELTCASPSPGPARSAAPSRGAASRTSTR